MIILQLYIVDVALKECESYEGLEFSGIPEGIPSLVEYLAVYCSAAVSIALTFLFLHVVVVASSIFIAIFRGIINLLAHLKSMKFREGPGQFENGRILRQGTTGRLEDDYSLSMKEQGCFVPSQKVLELRKKLLKFMQDHVYPNESEFYRLAQSSQRWTVHPDEEKLKELAKQEGLWNLWIPVRLYVLCFYFTNILNNIFKKGDANWWSCCNITWMHLQLDSAARARKLLEEEKYFSTGAWNSNLLGAGLSNLEYGCLCEIMGRSIWAPQIFNCGAPDTGNMEVM
ncbi:hypothetical protein BHM03_00028150 [Ensete ventricosum]|nr:hypothetical protein BHM03_00028150 [Ensete ventricosum]